jgi:hypothetical protein
VKLEVSEIPFSNAIHFRPHHQLFASMNCFCTEAGRVKIHTALLVNRAASTSFAKT